VSARRDNRRRSRSGGRSSRTRGSHHQERKVGSRSRSLYGSLRSVNRRRSRANKAATSAADSGDNTGHSLLDLINSSMYIIHHSSLPGRAGKKPRFFRKKVFRF